MLDRAGFAVEDVDYDSSKIFGAYTARKRSS
jgi:hypothetical protein